MFAVHAKGASNFRPLRTFGPKGRQPSRPKGRVHKAAHLHPLNLVNLLNPLNPETASR